MGTGGEDAVVVAAKAMKVDGGGETRAAGQEEARRRAKYIYIYACRSGGQGTGRRQCRHSLSISLDEVEEACLEYDSVQAGLVEGKQRGGRERETNLYRHRESPSRRPRKPR